MIDSLVFIVGAVFGSFLNVVALRYGTGLSFVSDRSRCFSCGKILRWFELIPILSFIFQNGRCRHCQARISPAYFLVELINGLVFLAIFLKIGADGWVDIVTILFYWLVFSILMVIALYDLRHKVIPDGFSIIFGFVALVGLVFIKFSPVGLLDLADTSGSVSPVGLVGQDFWLDLLAGPIYFAPFFILWFLSHGRLIGLGDGKLAVGIGWLLGFEKAGAALAYSFYFALIVALPMMFLSFRHKLKHKVGLKTEIPFAPFMIFSTLFVFLTSYTLFDLINYFAHLF